MKNLTKLIGIIALVAIIGFSFIACDTGGGGGGGGGKVSLKVKSSNNGGNAPARSVLNSRAVYTGEQIDTTSFSSLSTFYSGLSSGFVRSITPSKFIIAGEIGVVLSDGSLYKLGEGFFDFTKGLTVDFGEVQEDITVSALVLALREGGISVSDGPFGGYTGWSRVEFEWPNYTGSDTLENRKASFNANTGKYNEIISLPPEYAHLNYSPSWDGNKVTVTLVSLMPSLNGFTDNNIGTFVYGGSGKVRAYFDKYEIPMSEIIPGITKASTIGQNIGSDYARTMVIPYAPVNIPSGTSSILFDLSWNTNGIISQYKGTDNTENTADDIFVLKDKWWEDVAITVSVQ